MSLCPRTGCVCSGVSFLAALAGWVITSSKMPSFPGAFLCFSCLMALFIWWIDNSDVMVETGDCFCSFALVFTLMSAFFFFLFLNGKQAVLSEAVGELVRCLLASEDLDTFLLNSCCWGILVVFVQSLYQIPKLLCVFFHVE